MLAWRPPGAEPGRPQLGPVVGLRDAGVEVDKRSGRMAITQYLRSSARPRARRARERRHQPRRAVEPGGLGGTDQAREVALTEAPTECSTAGRRRQQAHAQPFDRTGGRSLLRPLPSVDRETSRRRQSGRGAADEHCRRTPCVRAPPRHGRRGGRPFRARPVRPCRTHGRRGRPPRPSRRHPHLTVIGGDRDADALAAATEEPGAVRRKGTLRHARFDAIARRRRVPPAPTRSAAPSSTSA